MREAEQKLNDLLVTSFENVGKMEERMLEASSNDLSIAEVHMLECVGQNPAGYSTISGIAQALDITLPTVTVAVKRLEKKGYVSIAPRETLRAPYAQTQPRHAPRPQDGRRA